MTLQVSILVKMQKIDDKISEREVLKNKLPNQLNELKNNVAKAEKNLNTIKESILNIQKKQKEKEAEIKANNDMILKYEHQLEGIKNNKEYKALNSQISLLNEKNKQVENQILSIMEEENEASKQQEEAIKLKKNADENLKANESILKKEIDKVDQEITELKDSRTELAKQLPMNLVKKYVQLIKNKNRKAIVFNNNDACSGCGFHIRPQILIELKTCHKIIYCENCGRILVHTLD
ncbi:MAG: C4-type zinc ribbon domain-containing protein [Candidatus Cloacimonetes bacterium]|nr:C4-type zinc ribbon domain-containing protein [Candidatus Cloacimonadota bacterium]